MFSCELCEIFKNSFSYRKTLVVASAMGLYFLQSVTNMVWIFRYKRLNIISWDSAYANKKKETFLMMHRPVLFFQSLSKISINKKAHEYIGDLLTLVKITNLCNPWKLCFNKNLAVTWTAPSIIPKSIFIFASYIYCSSYLDKTN